MPQFMRATGADACAAIARCVRCRDFPDAEAESRRGPYAAADAQRAAVLDKPAAAANSGGLIRGTA